MSDRSPRTDLGILRWLIEFVGPNGLTVVEIEAKSQELAKRELRKSYPTAHVIHVLPKESNA